MIKYLKFLIFCPCQHVKSNEDILEISNAVDEDDKIFSKVCDIIIDFCNVIERVQILYKSVNSLFWFKLGKI